MVCGVPRWQTRETPMDVLARASAYGDALLAARHQNVDFSSRGRRLQNKRSSEGVFRARKKLWGA